MQNLNVTIINSTKTITTRKNANFTNTFILFAKLY